MQISPFLGLALLLFAPLVECCMLSGKVVHDNVPISNAALEIHRAGQKIGNTTTLADGSYKVQYPEFPDSIQAIMVVATKPGYARSERLLFRQKGCAEKDIIDIELGSIDGITGDSNTIFISDYKIYGQVRDELTRNFNRELNKIVYHKILAYTSNLELRSVLPDISVQLADEPLDLTNSVAIRHFGHSRKALGVIAGDAEVVDVDGDEKRISLLSVFTTIPIYRNLQIAQLRIEDQLPLSRIRPSRIAESLKDGWARQAVLSYVLQLLADKKGSWSRNELLSLNELLIAVRATMQANDRLLEPLQQMIVVIDEELGQ